MIEKICDILMKRIRKQMPEIDDERAEVILYGLQLIIGEIPKILFVFVLGALIGLWWQTLLAFLLMIPYRWASGGFHLKTHIGCFILTTIMYCGNAFLSTVVTFPLDIVKYITVAFITVFGILMITKYAPADTENVPILTKKERKQKKILSYIFLIINMSVVLISQNEIVSNILIVGTFVQTISITRIAYKITKNEYGYEMYLKQNTQVI